MHASSITARRLGTAGAGLLFALGMTGCGAILEEAVEQAIESESGEGVEIDFDGEDGSISIEGENGEEFSIDVDAEDGSISIEGQDGEELSIDVDEDGESSVMSSTDEDGNTFEMTTGEGLPDNWPGELPVPSGNIAASTVMAENDNRILTLVVEVDDSASAHDAYVDGLTSNGFTVGSTSSFESDGQSSKFTEVSSDSWTGMVSSGVDSAGGPEQLVINFQSASS